MQQFVSAGIFVGGGEDFCGFVGKSPLTDLDKTLQLHASRRAKMASVLTRILTYEQFTVRVLCVFYHRK